MKLLSKLEASYIPAQKTNRYSMALKISVEQLEDALTFAGKSAHIDREQNKVEKTLDINRQLTAKVVDALLAGGDDSVIADKFQLKLYREGIKLIRSLITDLENYDVLRNKKELSDAQYERYQEMHRKFSEPLMLLNDLKQFEQTLHFKQLY